MIVKELCIDRDMHFADEKKMLWFFIAWAQLDTGCKIQGLKKLFVSCNPTLISFY